MWLANKRSTKDLKGPGHRWATTDGCVSAGLMNSFTVLSHSHCGGPTWTPCSRYFFPVFAFWLNKFNAMYLFPLCHHSNGCATQEAYNQPSDSSIHLNFCILVSWGRWCLIRQVFFFLNEPGSWVEVNYFKPVSWEVMYMYSLEQWGSGKTFEDSSCTWKRL